MRSTLHRRRLFTPLLLLALGLSSACASYEVVDYPSALDEVPRALWLSWDDTEQGGEDASAWRMELEDELALGYGSELDKQLRGWIDVNEGRAPDDGLQLELSVEHWTEGLFVPGVDPVPPVSVPTIVELRVDFIDAGMPMESIAVDCAVDARLWSISPHYRFELCGEQLGKATAKYIDARVAAR